MKFDPIGMFMGKNISQMSREELLEFATWASKKIQELEVVERATRDYRIDKEVKDKFGSLD